MSSIGDVMPLTKTERRVMRSMRKTYGSAKRAKQVFYASINSGRLRGKGIHRHNRSKK
jgi:hypothetical protein